MNAIVVFYSRTGTTKQVAEELAQSFNCDSEELIDTKKRSGPLGFMAAGKDAKIKKLTTLADTKHDPSLYNLGYSARLFGQARCRALRGPTLSIIS
jgi:flavodoxin